MNSVYFYQRNKIINLLPKPKITSKQNKAVISLKKLFYA